MALEANGSKVPISGVRCPIMLVYRPYGPRGRWEQGAHLGSKVSDYVGLPTLWPSRPMGARCPSREQGARLCWSADHMDFEADGSKVPMSGARCSAHGGPSSARSKILQNLHFGRSFRRTWLGVRPRAGVSHFAREQSQHGWEISLLEALGQGRVNLFLYGSAARGKGPLPIDPCELVPDLRIDEGGEELLGYGLIGANKPSKAAGVLHLVNSLLLGLLCPLSSTFGFAEFLLGLLGSVLGGCKFLFQLLNPPLSRDDLLLEGHDLFFSDALQGPSPTE
nr:hypothetical protein Iba_chr09aCG13540 [Ipomoea batatas]